MSEKIVARLTKEEVDRYCRLAEERRRIREEIFKLKEKQVGIEMEQADFFEKLGRKYGLIGGYNYRISHVTGEVREIDEEND